MRITLNGKPTDAYETPMPVSDLLAQLGLPAQLVLVELDGVALDRRDFGKAEVTGGAVVEIVRVAAGG